MTIHKMDLDWDCISFTIRVIKLLQQNNFVPVGQKEFNPIMGFNNNGTSAFLINGKIGNNMIRVIAMNQDKQIEISQGLMTDPKPLHKETFKDTEQILATDYLHEMITECLK